MFSIDSVLCFVSISTEFEVTYNIFFRLVRYVYVSLNDIFAPMWNRSAVSLFRICPASGGCKKLLATLQRSFLIPFTGQSLGMIFRLQGSRTVTAATFVRTCMSMKQVS